MPQQDSRRNRDLELAEYIVDEVGPILFDKSVSKAVAFWLALSEFLRKNGLEGEQERLLDRLVGHIARAAVASNVGEAVVAQATPTLKAVRETLSRAFRYSAAKGTSHARGQEPGVEWSPKTKTIRQLARNVSHRWRRIEQL